MENKINIAELLKDCPKGTELYSPLCGRCVFDRLNMGTIICKKQNTQEITFTSEGYYMLPAFNDCECVLFPSKDQCDWSKFQRPFKCGDIVALGYGDGAQLFIFKEYIHHDYAKCYMMLDGGGEIDFEIEDYHVARLATEEEKQKLFDAIKANGYKWNAETKTLEKLIEPKFKVGDKIRHKTHIRQRNTVTEIKDTHYILDDELALPFISQDDYELVPNKFDITTLVPFDKVLVRNKSNEVWTANFYSHYDATSDKPFICVGWSEMNEYRYCIPYDVNKELLGTTNNSEEYGSR